MRIAVSLKLLQSACSSDSPMFQSAVRIAVSLKLGLVLDGCGQVVVSIRRADRCLAEGTDPTVTTLQTMGFNPPCGSLSR